MGNIRFRHAIAILLAFFAFGGALSTPASADEVTIKVRVQDQIEVDGKSKKEPVKFEFTKGSPAALTVKLPQPKPGDLPKERPQAPAGGQDMAMMMMQQMFKDMKISLAIEVAGRIVQTNAEYKDASRVTLMEMDFNKVLGNPEKFKALSQAQPKTIEEAKALVKGTEGIKAETQPVVTVKFQ